MSKIVSLAELQTARAKLAEAGKVVVQCHGCFDIVHPGHIRHLSFARSQGDALIVTAFLPTRTADRMSIRENARTSHQRYGFAFTGVPLTVIV